MKLSKSYCKKVTPEGINYCGYWDGLYHFSKEVGKFKKDCFFNSKRGYLHFKFNADDILTNSHVKLIELGYTR